MRRLTAAAAAAVAAVGALGLAACSPNADDFQDAAENYIESRGFSETARLVEYTDAQCEEPESTAEDTIYTCTATAEDGSQWLFDVEITGKSDLKVLSPPTPAAQASADPPASDSTAAVPTTSAGPTTSAAGAATTSTTAASPTTTTSG